MPEADRNAALGKMFGTENVASARLLINSADRIEQLQKSQQNADQFNTDLQTASGGMQAERNRLENQRLVDLIPNAEKLNELDLQIRGFDNQIEAIKADAAVNRGAFAGAGAAVAGGILKDANAVVGGDVVPQVNEGLFQVFKSFFRTQEDIQRQQLEEQRKLAAAVIAQQQPRQPPAQQRQPVPQVRPQVAPLPAATAP